MTSHKGVILFAHGSRDPLWRRPVEAVARRVAELQPQVRVACAYLELTEPDLLQCAADLTAAGARHLVVVPMFLGVGRHAREDLPQLMDTLRRQHPAAQFDLQPAVGEHPALIDLLAHIALGGPD